MENATRAYFDKRGEVLVKNLRRRHFDAYYCADRAAALSKVLELIPEGSTVGWGGATSASQVGVQAALNAGNYQTIDRDPVSDPAERTKLMRACFDADYFITGANALSLDGQMVNIDGVGNRVGLIVYGPKHIIVVAGMNKVCPTLEDAVKRARTVAAPINQQRFGLPNPCTGTGVCADCLTETSICNQILITRNCKPAGRIKFVLVGEELGF
ncbi:MAG: lactate utilization protein [Oscillospiraceae bacterium]|nr:lactate utilization protein [Oscillospiraceae bacterium]